MASRTQLCSMLPVAALLLLGWSWSIGGQAPNGPADAGSEAVLPLEAAADTAVQQPDVRSTTGQRGTLLSSTEASVLRTVAEDASERCSHGRRLLAEGPRGASAAASEAQGSSPYLSAVSRQNAGQDDENMALEAYTAVCGGTVSAAESDYSAIGGGKENVADNAGTVYGGIRNTASSTQSTVGRGTANTASGYRSTVGGGEGNEASGDRSTVGGGYRNDAIGYASTVGGGEDNGASGKWSTVGGGLSNKAIGDESTIAGGGVNTASGEKSTVGGGGANQAAGHWSTVGGGRSNLASGDASTIGGGAINIASGYGSTIGGGIFNEASDSLSAIPGGYKLKLGKRSFGFSGQTREEKTDLSAYSNIAAFVDVDLWLYSVSDLAPRLRFYELSGAGMNYTAFQAQRQRRDIVYVLPAALGRVGDVLRIASVWQDVAVLEWAPALGMVPSSLRYKNEVRPIREALEKVLRLRGVEFRWKPEYGGGEDIGFIVEEVAPVVPQVVDRDPQTGEPLGMDYGRLTALLVEAIKEQQRELEQQRSEIERQRREIEQLRLLVEQLLQERGSRGGEMGGGVQIHDAWLGQNIPNPFEGPRPSRTASRRISGRQSQQCRAAGLGAVVYRAAQVWQAQAGGGRPVDAPSAPKVS
ncbi:MAG: tail fiber domain-containing protein [Chlorobiota bacterium]